MDPMAPAAEPAIARQGGSPAGAAQLLHVLQAASARCHPRPEPTGDSHTAPLRPGLLVV